MRPPQITEKTVRKFIDDVSDQHFAMAGAITAVSAAQAAALGEACMQISLENQLDKLDWAAVTAQIEQMSHLKNMLVEWCNQDATAIAEYTAPPNPDMPPDNQEILCEGPAEICRLVIEAAQMLQQFRPLLLNRVKDDLEVALSLLVGSARAALLLLDGNLRLWPNPVLVNRYDPIIAELEAEINQLQPAKRIRS